jgi:hypothetical protein
MQFHISSFYKNHSEFIKECAKKLNNEGFKEFNNEVEVIFDLKEKNECIKIKFSELLYNIILLKPYFKFNVPIDSSYFTKHFNQDFFNNKMNLYIDEFSNKIDIQELKNCLFEIKENISDIAGLVNWRKGSTIDIFSILKEIKEDEDFRKLFFYKIDTNDSIHEAEEKMNKIFKNEFVVKLKEKNTCLKPYLNSGVGMSPKQLREVFFLIGYKPNLRGEVIEKPVNNSFLNGIDDVLDYFHAGIGTMKALITNHRNVKLSGYLTRKLLLLMLDTKFSTEEDCKTKYYLLVDVRSQFILNMLAHKYYLDPETNELKIINPKKDKHLIGQKIKIRSAITCCAKDGGVCKTCYGKLLYDVNKQFHPGLLAVFKFTVDLTQKLLSSKHLLVVNADIIEWTEDILEYFDVENSMLTPKKNFKIKFKKDKIMYDELNRPYVENFNIIISRTESIELDFPTKIIISGELLKMINKSPDFSIQTKNIPENGLTYITENKEFAKSLNQIQQILETSDHLLNTQNIHTIINKLYELLEENGIFLSSSHIEMIFKRLIRNTDNIEESLDFSKSPLDPYVVLRVSSAILNSGSPLLALSFEKVKQQLKNPKTYKRSKSSLIDNFYK